MMKKKPDTKLDMELAAFFDAAIEADAAPQAAFLEAIAADAQRLSDERANTTARPAVSPPWWAVLLRNLGGWQPVTALMTSVFLGMIAGYVAPDSVDYLDGEQDVAEDFSMDSFSVASDIETLFQEG